MIKVNINDQVVEVEPGATILDAARLAGVNIPTLCHHPKLHPYGSCRLCLVEVQGARTLVPSCTAPVTDNMVVQTETPRVKKARKFVLSMIFSERNHFCMYCQATDGDCELQSAAYAEDMTSWPFTPPYSPFAVDASHPDFILDNNRCILCRRCVRTCAELVGVSAIGFENRGSASILSLDSGVPFVQSSCVSCGNCVQNCPTGALIDRRSAYLGRKTDFTHTESVCIDCGLGCGRDVLTRDNRLVRLEGVLDAPVNQGLLCQFGRFAPMDAVKERITSPMVRRNGQLVPVSWDEALDVIAAQMKVTSSADIAAYISPRLSAETLSAFSELFRDHFQVGHIGLLTGDHTASTALRLSAEFGTFESDLSVLADCDAALVYGADVLQKQQVAGFLLKRHLQETLFFDPQANRHDALAAFTEVAGRSTNPVLVVGEQAARTENLANLRDLLVWAAGAGVKVVMLKGKANAYAAALYGIQPGAAAQPSKLGFMLIGDQPVCEHSRAALENCAFRVVQGAYWSELTDRADVVLPSRNWLEEAGHYLSTDGKLNLNRPALQSADNVPDSVETLTVLARKLGLTLNNNWMAAMTNQPTSITLAL